MKKIQTFTLNVTVCVWFYRFEVQDEFLKVVKC